MAKVKMLGDAIVVVSTLKTEEIKMILKHDRDALCLRRNDGEGSKGTPVFGIDLARSGDGGISNNGIIFNSTDEEGFASLTFIDAAGKTRAAKLANVKENYATAIIRLNTLEQYVAHVVEAMNTNFDRAMDAVEFVDAATAPDEIPVTEAAEEVEAVEE